MMACEMIKSWWFSVFVMVVCSYMQHCCVHGSPQVPCFFIFGDSLSDSGNNNHLATAARANYSPYGTDYPGGSKPTGRFTNGRTTVDFIAEYLGFDHHIPPFTTASGSDMLQGVNYASGSAGIIHQTGRHLGENIGLKRQVQNHKICISRIAKVLGKNESAVNDHLSKCLYYVGIGSNDYLNNYFLPEKYPSSKTYSLEQYAKLLVQHYSKEIRTLYKTGARKFALVGLGQIGCCPRAIQLHTNGSACAEKLNKASRLFNEELISLVKQLNDRLSGSRLIYINVYGKEGTDSSATGMVLTKECCKVRDDGQCAPNKKPCKNRGEYVFWDSFHPTEVQHKKGAAKAYSATDSSDSYPFDILHLAQLNLKEKAWRTI